MQLQEEARILGEALLEARVAHTEAATHLSNNLLLRRDRLQQEQADIDLPALQ